MLITTVRVTQCVKFFKSWWFKIRLEVKTSNLTYSWKPRGKRHELPHFNFLPWEHWTVILSRGGPLEFLFCIIYWSQYVNWPWKKFNMIPNERYGFISKSFKIISWNCSKQSVACLKKKRRDACLVKKDTS